MKIKCNVGKTEKIIRIIIGLIFIYLGFTISPWFYIIAGIAFLTAFVGFCPVTHLFGINTCKIKDEKTQENNLDQKDAGQIS